MKRAQPIHIYILISNGEACSSLLFRQSVLVEICFIFRYCFIFVSFIFGTFCKTCSVYLIWVKMKNETTGICTLPTWIDKILDGDWFGRRPYMALGRGWLYRSHVCARCPFHGKAERSVGPNTSPGLLSEWIIQDTGPSGAVWETSKTK